VGSEPGNLPLLEFLLTELWARRERGCLTHAAYAAIGGVKGAIATRAEAELKRLTAEEREALRRVMIRLVTPGEGRADTRAVAEIPVADAAAEVVVRRFADARLLTTGRDEASGHETVEVSHEALIREWGTYRRWVDADREFLRTVERVKDAMRAWAEEKADKDSRLLAPGRPLEEARELLSRQDALIDDIRPYIEASIAKDDARLAEEQGRLQRELAIAQQLASQTLLANWYAEQAIDITLGFVKKAVDLSDSFEIPRSAIEVLLTRADAAFKKLMQEGQSSPHELHDRQKYDVASQLRSARAQLLMFLADHYRIIGDVKQQHEKAKQACDMLKELVTEYPSSPEWLQHLAFCHDLIGEVFANQLQLNAALAEHRASRSIREKLWKDLPSDPHLQWCLSISDIKIGDVNYELEHLGEALDAFDSARKIIHELARADPANRERQRDLLMIDHRIGEVLTKQGDLNGADKVYRTSLDIAEQLAAADPSNIQFQRDLAASHEKIGSNLEDQGDMEAALAAYRISLSITKRLAADDPEKVPIQSDLSLGYENVGRILLKQHHINAALDALRTSIAISEQLAADPANASLQRDLSIKLNNMGDALKEQGELQAALDYYQRSLAIRNKLAAADPSNTELQRHVLHSHKRIGDILHAQGQFQEEIGEYQAYI
jgi:tetratricopeptide (TPR) repeat protein